MSNKKFGYARVSTTEQNEDRQVLDLMEYGIDERDIYVDKQSGRSFERTNYLALRNTKKRTMALSRGVLAASIMALTSSSVIYGLTLFLISGRLMPSLGSSVMTLAFLRNWK